ncbi:MAG: hypothetical protein QM722_02535 [Piscinibacter sp.]
MKTLLTLRSLTLAVATVLASLAAHAALPEESWWQRDGDTLGLHVQEQGFCAISTDHAVPATLWIVRGELVDGRLVEASRKPLGAAPVASLETPTQRLDPPDFFVQPTAMVSRERTTDTPRGSFAIYQPLSHAPSDSLWLSLAWHCGDAEQVDKMAALHGPE